jgi:hypothetical protein
MPVVTWTCLGIGLAVSAVFIAARCWFRHSGQEMPEVIVMAFNFFGVLIGFVILLGVSASWIIQAFG